MEEQVEHDVPGELTDGHGGTGRSLTRRRGESTATWRAPRVLEATGSHIVSVAL